MSTDTHTTGCICYRDPYKAPELCTCRKVPSVRDLIAKLSHDLPFTWSGGYGETCDGCRWAGPHCDRLGNPIPYSEYADDTTESYFTCNLPGREGRGPQRGETAPCTAQEWIDGAIIPQIEVKDDEIERLEIEQKNLLEVLASHGLLKTK